MIVKERVACAGILLDVVLDAVGAQRTLEPFGCTPQRPVVGPVAPDDRAGAGTFDGVFLSGIIAVLLVAAR